MKPLFINGYSKSGTSLLVALLDGHKDINVIPEETDYFDSTYFLVNHFLANDDLSLDDKIEIIYNHIINSTHINNFFKGIRENDPKGNFDYRNFNASAFRECFIKKLHLSGLSHENVFYALASAYCTGIGNSSTNKYWLEKTPFHDLNVVNREDILNKNFKNYKVIHIVRDPRDNYIAYSKKRPKLSLFDICYEWNRAANLGLKWQSKDSILIIRYEDLVLNTKDTVSLILNFLNLNEYPCIFKPTKNGVPWKGNSMFDQKSTEISKDRVGRYKSMLGAEEKKLIEVCCSHIMTQLNYPFSTNSNNILPLNYQKAKLKTIYKQRIKSIKLQSKIFYKYKTSKDLVNS